MTLALMLINPILLWVGGAMASAPILIHLLNRMRFRRVAWAAMEFLLAAHRKNARRVRIEQIILLLIRTLIILLLALAVARPILEGMLAGLGRSAVHRIVVIDDSYSMAAEHGVDARPIIKDAEETVEWLLDSFDDRDGVSLVTAGSRPHTRIPGPTLDHEKIADEVGTLAASDSATDIAGALAATKKIIGDSDQERRVVYLLTDSTRAAWRDTGGESLSALASAIVETSGTSFVVVDLGQENLSNLTVAEFAPEKSVATSEVATWFTIRVVNHGAAAAEDVTVRISIDGQPEGTVSFGRVEPGEAGKRRRWATTFARPGGHKLAAAIKAPSGDAVPNDSTRYLALDVKEALDVLLVDGEPNQGLGEVDALYLALDPRMEGETRQTIFHRERIRDTELNASQLDGRDVIVLANVASPDAEQVAALEQFVAAGGSLIVFLGDQVRLQDYNRLLYAANKGLLPASLGEPVGTLEAGDEATHTTFDVEHFEHPALAAFREKEGGAGFGAVAVYRRFQLKAPIDAGAGTNRVVLQFADGTPAIVEKQFGRGRVALVGTTADAEWTNWPRQPVFLELAHELTNYMTPNVLWRTNRLVDSTTTLPVSAAERGERFRVERPGYDAVDVTPEEIGSAAGQRFGLVLDDLGEAGFYTIRGKNRELPVAVNVDVAEGDLEHADEQAVAERLGHAGIVHARGLDGLRETMREQAAAGGWARNFLVAMLALLLLETLLAWFFNRNA